MKKLSVLGIIGGAALLTAAPFSLQWTQKNVALSLDSSEARIGRPGTALSVAGVHRRAYRRAVRSTVYGIGAAPHLRRSATLAPQGPVPFLRAWGYCVPSLSRSAMA